MEDRDTGANDLDAGVPEWLIRVGRISWLAIGVGIAATAAVAAVMALRELVIPVVLAALLGAGFIPLVDRLEKRRVPRPLGSVLVIVLIVGVFAGVIAVVTIGLTSQADELGDQFDVAVEERKERRDRLDPDGDFLDQFRDGSESAGPHVWSGLPSRAGAIVRQVRQGPTMRLLLGRPIFGNSEFPTPHSELRLGRPDKRNTGHRRTMHPGVKRFRPVMRWRLPFLRSSE